VALIAGALFFVFAGTLSASLLFLALIIRP
jgi:hypothetical protein